MMKEAETSAERFVRIMESRVNQIAEILERMAKMPGRTYFEYTSEQVATIFDYLRNKLAETEQAFRNRQPANHFSLSEVPDED